MRRYINKPLDAGAVAALQAEIAKCNEESGLHIQLILDEPRAFSAGMLKYGTFSGVDNYFVMAGPRGKDAEEKIGWWGEHLVLLAQTLGLNTCWVGLTYKKIPGTYQLSDGEVVHCVISLGYGENQGVQHPLRPVERLYEADGEVPDWFRAGMEAVLLAPTAINQQKFKFILHPGGKVEAKPLFSMAGYTVIDLGIAKYHFQAAAGKENFEWQ